MSDSQERFLVRTDADRPIRLTVAEMTPDEMLAAVAFMERELAHMTRNAAPALALLGRAAAGDQVASQRELREAREMVATLARVYRQTDRLRAAVRALQPAAAAP